MRKAMMLAAGLMVAGLPCLAAKADSDSFASVLRDYGDAESAYEALAKSADDYISASLGLRQMDEDELKALITELCALDIARDGDAAAVRAEEMQHEIESKVLSNYSEIKSEADNLLVKIPELSSRMLKIEDNAEGFRDDEEVQDDAGKIFLEAASKHDALEGLLKKVESDTKTLLNIKEGNILGSNKPKIRAAIEYGKDQHKELQKSCDAKEVYVEGVGFADCVRFTKDHCMVVEFKPSTHSTTSAFNQAFGYVKGIQLLYKEDDRATTSCMKDSNGAPIFGAEAEFYRACEP